MTNWLRPNFKKASYDGLTFLVIFGDFNADFKISKNYNVSEIPEGIEIMSYNKEEHLSVIESFKVGYVWDQLSLINPSLRNNIDSSNQCYIIKGETTDSDNLNYMKNVVGITSYLLDNGGVAVNDIQTLKYWDHAEWDKTIFEKQEESLNKQVVILHSNENGGKWYHTRGMRKFGRPDISIHNIHEEDQQSIIRLINDLINLQINGEIIKDGKEIIRNDLPKDLWCQNRGDFEDSDFNNKHIELNWK